nr:MFS transporter [Bacilli bacterium]
MKSSSLFRNRNYLLLFIGQALSLIGSNVYSFALLWDMKIMTQNPFLMSLVGIGWMLPQIVLGPIAGVIVDRFAKRGIMYLSDMIRFVITFLVTFLAFTHLLTPLEMIVVAFLSNIVATVFNPAAGAITPRIVQEDQLATANGLEQAMTPIAMILGPALSAGLISLVGVSASFGFNAITFLISFITIFLLRVNEPPKERKPFTAS